MSRRDRFRQPPQHQSVRSVAFRQSQRAAVISNFDAKPAGFKFVVMVSGKTRMCTLCRWSCARTQVVRKNLGGSQQ
jgi:hypothetical protein